jgi:hypothetical protein
MNPCLVTPPGTSSACSSLAAWQDKVEDDNNCQRKTATEATMANTPEIEPLIVCPDCKVEMRLFGIESESPIRELYTFECIKCGRIEVRGVLVALPYSENSK